MSIFKKKEKNLSVEEFKTIKRHINKRFGEHILTWTIITKREIIKNNYLLIIAMMGDDTFSRTDRFYCSAKTIKEIIDYIDNYNFEDRNGLIDFNEKKNKNKTSPYLTPYQKIILKDI